MPLSGMLARTETRLYPTACRQPFQYHRLSPHCVCLLFTLLQVDLIVCYDATSSPTRSIQRMGRTGRHREGRVVYILAAGREAEQYNKIEEVCAACRQLCCPGRLSGTCMHVFSRLLFRQKPRTGLLLPC